MWEERRKWVIWYLTNSLRDIDWTDPLTTPSSTHPNHPRWVVYNLGSPSLTLIEEGEEGEEEEEGVRPQRGTSRRFLLVHDYLYSIIQYITTLRLSLLRVREQESDDEFLQKEKAFHASLNPGKPWSPIHTMWKYLLFCLMVLYQHSFSLSWVVNLKIPSFWLYKSRWESA